LSGSRFYVEKIWGKNKRISRENALGSHFDVLLEGKLDHKQKRRENAMIRRGGYYAYLNLPSDADG